MLHFIQLHLFSFDSFDLNISDDAAIVTVSLEPLESFTYYLAIAQPRHSDNVMYGNFSEPHIALSWAGGKLEAVDYIDRMFLQKQTYFLKVS